MRGLFLLLAAVLGGCSSTNAADVLAQAAQDKATICAHFSGYGVTNDIARIGESFPGPMDCGSIHVPAMMGGGLAGSSALAVPITVDPVHLGARP